MPAPYSTDLRERIVEAYKSGKGSARMLAKMFDVGKSTVTDYLRLDKLNGNVNPKKATGGQQAHIDTKGLAFIRKCVEKNPDIMLAVLCEKYFKRRKIKVSTSMMCRALKKMNLRRKKKSLYASEQERKDVKKKEKVSILNETPKD